MIGLSLSGGGSKGVGIAKLLALIEEESGKQAYELFDIIGGTSTGGIIACGLSVGIPAKTIYEEYAKSIPKVFNRGWRDRIRTLGGIRAPKYKSDGLKESLKRVLGDKRLSDCKTDIVIPVYNIANKSSEFIKNTKYYDMYLWQVALATSSAPYYFNPYLYASYAYVDGGVHSNDASLVTAVECIKRGQDPRVLSITLDGIPEYDPPQKFNKPGSLKLLKSLVEYFMNSSDSAIAHQSEKLLADDYLQCKIKAPFSMDESSKSMIEDMRTYAMWAWDDNKTQIMEFINGV